MRGIDFPPRATPNEDGELKDRPVQQEVETVDQYPAAKGDVNEVGETRAEQRANQTVAVEEIEKITSAKLAERAGISDERNAASAALDARRNSFKEYLRATATFKKIKEPNAQQLADFKIQEARFKTMDAEAKRQQLAYAISMQDSVKERVENKNWDEQKADKVTARYNRIVRLREVTLPLANQEQEVREELLDEKGRNIFQKTLKVYGDLNKKVEKTFENRLLEKGFMGKKLTPAQAERYGRVGARLARVLTFAALGSTIGFTAGGVAATVAGGRAAWSISRFALGTGAGLLYGRNFAETEGKRRSAEFEAMQHQDITSLEDLAAQEKVQHTSSKEGIEKARTKRENLVTLFSSLGLSVDAAVHAGGLEAISNAASRLWHEFGIGEAHAETIHAVPGAAVKGVSAIVAPNTHVEAPVLEHVEIKGHVNNADRLFGHFKDDLLKHHPDLAKNPAMKALIAHGKTQDQLTKWLGFQDKNGASSVMHKGDQVLYKDGKVIFKPFHGKEFTIVDEKGQVHALKLPKHAPAIRVPKVHHAVSAPAPRIEHTLPPPNVTPEALTPTPSDTELPVQVPKPAITIEKPAAPAGPLRAEDILKGTKTSIPGTTIPTTGTVSGHSMNAEQMLGHSTGAGVTSEQTLPPRVPSKPALPTGGGHAMSAEQMMGRPTGTGAAVAEQGVSSSAHIDSGIPGGHARSAAEMLTSAPKSPTIISSPEAVSSVDFVNPHNVGISNAIPGTYEWKTPSGATIPLEYGGTTEQVSSAARTHVQGSLNSSAFFINEKKGFLGFGKEKFVSSWNTDSRGNVTLTERALDANGRPMKLPNPNDFIRKV